MKLELYVGLPTDIDEKTKNKLFDIVNVRHPDGVLGSIVDGYWSGVEESTLLIKLESKLEFAQKTAEIIKSLTSNGFVALCESEE